MRSDGGRCACFSPYFPGRGAVPFTSHGNTVTDEVTLVRWHVANREAAPADAHDDEFVLRGKLPAHAGPLWFKVRQTCKPENQATTTGQSCRQPAPPLTAF